MANIRFEYDGTHPVYRTNFSGNNDPSLWSKPGKRFINVAIHNEDVDKFTDAGVNVRYAGDEPFVKANIILNGSYKTNVFELENGVTVGPLEEGVIDGLDGTTVRNIDVTLDIVPKSANYAAWVKLVEVRINRDVEQVNRFNSRFGYSSAVNNA